jgi:hypothetical protein
LPNGSAIPTVSNSSIAVAGQNVTRLGLYVFNPSPTVTLSVAPSPIPAVVAGAGSFSIQPQQGFMFGPPNMPSWTAGMNATASSAGSNVIVILEFYQ